MGAPSLFSSSLAIDSCSMLVFGAPSRCESAERGVSLGTEGMLGGADVEGSTEAGAEDDAVRGAVSAEAEGFGVSGVFVFS